MLKFTQAVCLTAALAVMSFGLLTDVASARPKSEGAAGAKRVCAKMDGMFTVENSGATSCVLISQGLSRNCSASGECAVVDNRRPEGAPSGGPRGDGKGMDDGKGKVTANDPNRGWNGQYTTVVVTDARGTSSYAVKQGVPIENGQKILAPNGASYNVWDPELARQLKAAGVSAAYANPATAKNEYNLARDKIVRDRAIAAGKPVSQPTGHRNLDALGNAAPVVHDRRNDVATSKPGGAPPAAAPGTVSATTPTPGDATQPAVRDHRHLAGTASVQGGGVAVGQMPRITSGSSSGSPAKNNNERKKH